MRSRPHSTAGPPTIRLDAAPADDPAVLSVPTAKRFADEHAVLYRGMPKLVPGLPNPARHVHDTATQKKVAGVHGSFS